MTSKELFIAMAENQKPKRLPFVPTIYEHAAKLLGKTPSKIANDEELLIEAQLASYDLYHHDLISVGVDIYNVEVEALGAKVTFYQDETLPSIKETLIKNETDLKHLDIPNPEKDARMPLMLNATNRIHKQLNHEVIVNGAIVGPFTLAAILRGFENIIMDLLLNPNFAVKLMHFAKQVSLSYAKSFANRNIGLSINESWISPPLLSPELYCKYVFPIEKELINEVKRLGINNVGLISGGNTSSIAKYLLETGTSLLMADYNTDQQYFKNLCQQHGVILRASIESQIVESGTTEELTKAIKSVLSQCGDYHKLIFGCGIISYHTSPERVLKLKNMVQALSSTNL